MCGVYIHVQPVLCSPMVMLMQALPGMASAVLCVRHHCLVPCVRVCTRAQVWLWLVPTLLDAYSTDVWSADACSRWF